MHLQSFTVCDFHIDSVQRQTSSCTQHALAKQLNLVGGIWGHVQKKKSGTTHAAGDLGGKSNSCGPCQLHRVRCWAHTGCSRLSDCAGCGPSPKECSGCHLWALAVALNFRFGLYPSSSIFTMRFRASPVLRFPPD